MGRRDWIEIVSGRLYQYDTYTLLGSVVLPNIWYLGEELAQADYKFNILTTFFVDDESPYTATQLANLYLAERFGTKE